MAPKSRIAYEGSGVFDLKSWDQNAWRWFINDWSLAFFEQVLQFDHTN